MISFIHSFLLFILLYIFVSTGSVEQLIFSCDHFYFRKLLSMSGIRVKEYIMLQVAWAMSGLYS